MSPLTSFSSPRALPQRRKTSSCRPCRASREAATTSARICRRPMHAGEGGGARQSARTLGGTVARPLESMAHRTQLSAERPQRSGAPNGCAPCQWRADAQARERRCPSFSMELAMSSVSVPCWSARRPVRILFSKSARGRLDRSLLWNLKNLRLASAAKIISAKIGYHLKRARETRFLQNAFIL